MNRINPRLLNWASEIDQITILQAEKTARLPIVEGHVALMPDAHLGIGATVGSVIPTKDAIIPAAVGVDIGCGMIASETNLSASDLPDNLDLLLKQVERAVPAGVGQGHARISQDAYYWMSRHQKHSEFDSKQNERALSQFGSLGSGNHFAEVCLDERDVVWFVLHSGSRGIGNQLAEGHIKKAKSLARYLDEQLEDPNLAYFLEGEDSFNAYIKDMLWAQEYAFANRAQMMHAFATTALDFVGKDGSREMRRINCHHNFTQREVHDGVHLWITRKGAIKADVNDLGVIPGSMGTRSYIVQGLGNPLSWNSCSHGAGRRMSRSKAKKEFTVEDLALQMKGKTWLSDRAGALLDEIPSSYKDIDAVMDDQKDLVSVVHTLHQVLNYKGA